NLSIQIQSTVPQVRHKKELRDFKLHRPNQPLLEDTKLAFTSLSSIRHSASTLYVQNKSLLSDGLVYALAKAIPATATLVTVVVFMRLVGVVEYGKYSLVLSSATALSALSTG